MLINRHPLKKVPEWRQLIAIPNIVVINRTVDIMIGDKYCLYMKINKQLIDMLINRHNLKSFQNRYC